MPSLPRNRPRRPHLVAGLLGLAVLSACAPAVSRAAPGPPTTTYPAEAGPPVRVGADTLSVLPRAVVAAPPIRRLIETARPRADGRRPHRDRRSRDRRRHHPPRLGHPCTRARARRRRADDPRPRALRAHRRGGRTRPRASPRPWRPGAPPPRSRPAPERRLRRAAPHRRGLGPSLSRVGREAPRQGGGRRRPSRPLRQRQLDGRRLRPQPRARHRLRLRARRDHPPRRDARRLGELRPVSRRQRVGYQAVWPVTAPEPAAAAGGAGSIDSPPPARPTSVPSGAGRAPLSGRRRSTTSPRTPVPGTGPRGFGVGAGAWVAAGAPTMALGAATAAGAGVTGAGGGATAGT